MTVISGRIEEEGGERGDEEEAEGIGREVAALNGHRGRGSRLRGREGVPRVRPVPLWRRCGTRRERGEGNREARV